MAKEKKSAGQKIASDIKNVGKLYWLNLVILHIALAAISISIFGFGPIGIGRKLLAFGVYFIIYIALMSCNKSMRDNEKTWIRTGKWPVSSQSISRSPSQISPTRPIDPNQKRSE